MIFVFDTNDRHSWERVENLYRHIQSMRQDKKLALLVVGNKCDLPSTSPLFTRLVSHEEIKAFTTRRKMHYVDFSAKYDDVLDIFRPLVREVLRIFDFGRTTTCAFLCSAHFRSLSNGMRDTVVCEHSGELNVAKHNGDGKHSYKAKRKYLALRSGRLLLYNTPEDKKPKEEYEITSNCVVTSEIIKDTEETQVYPFTVKFGKRSLTFTTNTAADRAAWVSVRFPPFLFHLFYSFTVTQFISFCDFI